MKSEMVYDVLRKAILANELPPGSAIDQNALALRLQVSRTPLRQALVRLHAEGLVTLEPHGNAVVSPLSSDDIREVYAIRAALESMLAEVGSVEVDAEVVAAMNEFIAQQGRAWDARATHTFVQLDRKFHETLYRASGFFEACDLAARLRDRSDRYIELYASYEQWGKNFITEHTAILDAVRNGDSAAVKRLTHSHVANGMDVLLTLMADAPHSSRPISAPTSADVV
jgi:DNA-binding GntR family transcriptional regulator